MPSSATTRNRFEKQGTGENPNTWGNRLNTTGLDLIDEALDGFESIALTGNYTLTSINFASDQARKRFLKFTGSVPATVTIPAVPKVYAIWNATSETLTITMGGSDTAVLAAGARQWVFCTGTGVYTETAAPIATAAATNASNSATAAANSQANAAASASAASSSATSAANSANDANSSAIAAAASAASLNTSNLVDRTNPQTIGGLKTFENGIAINGNTIDGLTALGASIAEAADANAVRALIGGTWTPLSSANVSGSTSVAQTNLAGYSEVLVVFESVTQNNNAQAASLNLATSQDNGSTYLPANSGTPVSTAKLAGNGINGAVYVLLTERVSVLVPAAPFNETAIGPKAISQTAKANAVRIALFTDTFTGGTIRFYAR